MAFDRILGLPDGRVPVTEPGYAEAIFAGCAHRSAPIYRSSKRRLS